MFFILNFWWQLLFKVVVDVKLNLFSCVFVCLFQIRSVLQLQNLKFLCAEFWLWWNSRWVAEGTSQCSNFTSPACYMRGILATFLVFVLWLTCHWIQNSLPWCQFAFFVTIKWFSLLKFLWVQLNILWSQNFIWLIFNWKNILKLIRMYIFTIF